MLAQAALNAKNAEAKRVQSALKAKNKALKEDAINLQVTKPSHESC